MKFLAANFQSLLIIALFVYIVLFAGNKGCNRGEQKPDTVYQTETKWEPQPTVNVPQYQPIVIESKQPIVIPSQYQLPSDPVALKAYCEEIIKKYLTENKYFDSTVLRDSAGNNVGVFRNEDWVSENMIKIRKPSYTLRFPHTIERITITNPAPLTRQVFLGMELNGNMVNPIRDFKASLLFKNKKDRIFKAGIGWSLPTSQPVYEIGTYWKLKLRN